MWGSPVRYLRDSKSQCVEQMTQDFCSSTSRLNARLHVESTTLQDSACPKTIVVHITLLFNISIKSLFFNLYHFSQFYELGRCLQKMAQKFQ